MDKGSNSKKDRVTRAVDAAFDDSKLDEIFTKLNVLREDIEFNVEDLKDLEKTVWNAQDSIEELKNEIQRLKNEIQRLKDKEK